MKAGGGNTVMFWLATGTGLWLLCNLVALPLAWGGVNASGGFLALVQWVILLGFLLVLSFDLVAMVWIAGMKRRQTGQKGWGAAFALGFLALVSMVGAKVMVDEIARETPLGRGGGEWGVLYALLVLQLAFIAVVLFRARGR